MQRAPCWSKTDQISLIDTVLRGWQCTPIYVIQQHDAVDQCEIGEDHVFDGAHKLEAVFDFMNNKFAYKCPEGKPNYKYSGMTFQELPKSVQEKIKTYSFSINVIDPETAGSPDDLHLLWERVNKSGKKVNAYELALPLTSELVKHVIKPCMDQFAQNKTFFPSESSRGSLEMRLMIILALNDLDGTTNIKSINEFIRQWIDDKIGAQMIQRQEHIDARGEQMRGTLQRAYKIFSDLEQANVFCNDEGTSLLERSQQNVEIPFVLGVLSKRYPKIEDFRRQKQPIIQCLIEHIFSVQDLHSSVLDCGTRSGVFQSRLLKYIENRLPCATVEKRLFSKKQIEFKLQCQKNICPLCSKKILAHHLFDGDHVVEWSRGGLTDLDNLDVVHRSCHQKKG